MWMAMVSHKHQQYSGEGGTHCQPLGYLFLFIIYTGRDGAEEGMVLAREAISELPFSSTIQGPFLLSLPLWCTVPEILAEAMR